MANTYTSLHYHIVFSTKNREPWITRDIEDRVWKLVGGIARKHDMTALRVGGIEDHLHSLITAPPKYAPCDIARILKGESSKWIHEKFPAKRLFSWQDGYGAFSVSKSEIPDLLKYIENQREHHKKRTFQEEYLDFLRAYQIRYDERYLWG
jgi:REP element-mobilizing transposase RayT